MISSGRAGGACFRCSSGFNNALWDGCIWSQMLLGLHRGVETWLYNTITKEQMMILCNYILFADGNMPVPNLPFEASHC